MSLIKSKKLLIFGNVLILLFGFNFLTGKSIHKVFIETSEVINATGINDLYDLAVSENSSPEQSILTLSFLAEAYLGYGLKYPKKQIEVKRQLERIIKLILTANSRPFNSLDDQSKWRDWGLYLSHLNIILGTYLKLYGNEKYEEINRNISEYLTENIINSPKKNIKSYPNHEEIWPADNAASLYSLFIYDKNNGTDLSREPIRQWLEFMNSRGIDPKTNLFISELNNINAYSPHPRGCALSWTVKYMSHFAPEEAQNLWHIYKKKMKINFLFNCGFREYPCGISFPNDSDSGPIIMGMGSAATGLALMASKSIGDDFTYFQLINSLKFMDFALFVKHDAEISKAASNLLAIAIRFNAKLTVNWNE